MAITAAQVKELREMTGAGMMDCKKALVECEGDFEAAKDWLRKKGISKAEKKEGRTAAEGLSRVKAEGNRAVVVEINSETDFVAKNEKFLALLDETVDVLMKNAPADLDAALALPTSEGTMNDAMINATAIIGEKIKLRRFEIVEKADDEVFGMYMHNGGQISALTVMKGGDAQIAKEMAMQVASMSPSYVSRADLPAEVIAHERTIQEELLNQDPKNANKPEQVKAKIIEGRISKSLEEMCLVDQIFFLDQDKKVGTYLNEKKAECVRFVRFKVGEGIEKKESDFAAEVAAMVK
ncbi:MAG: elongation factor Ts [Solobacterium sp.]|nr:elongation factor Ts [Solobacterium sp.]MBQ1320690.1 elongation factor Ts [Solobacterium sp.]MBQ1355955.1 elongation factor Ts [Solobacterium sp.]